MRAFLSHSSKDKGYVEATALSLTPGTFELDAQTFDAGLINSQAIIESLRRVDLFVLFLSNNSVNSSYVNFESLLGIEFIASGRIAKFLAICIDEESFEAASASVKFFNVVRRAVDPDAAARLIQGHLISAAADAGVYSHPFVGREVELRELERQISDPQRGALKALYVAGNHGSGRRSVARKFYRDQYPHVGPVFPEIHVDDYTGLEELFRIVLAALRPSISARQLRIRVEAFSVADVEEKRRQIADLLNALLAAREAALLVDNGGVLNDEGAFEGEIDALVDRLQGRPHPPICVISPRMVPLRFRRPNDVAYVSVRTLEREPSVRLFSRLLKDAEVSVSGEQLEQLVELTDGHPFNFYRLIDEVRISGVSVLLSDTAEFINWKHRQSSEYLSKIILSGDESNILGLLKLLPSLDFTAIVDALPDVKAETLSVSLLRLVGLHIIESSGDNFRLSPALKVAIERDKRVGLESGQRSAALAVLAKSLELRIDEGAATISLIDAAVISAIEANIENTAFASAFLLPSHYVWLAKRNYDQRNFHECIRLAKAALRSSGRLSAAALVAAYRFMCLAAARVGETNTFEDGINNLQQRASDNWRRSNVAFLRGFNSRMYGNLPQAEDHFRESYRLSSGNISAAREIASICLLRGDLDEAEKFAREARAVAPSNPYVNDMLISVLVRKLGKKAAQNPEVVEMFDILEQVGEEDGRSFYSTRKAELEHLWGDNRLALSLIESAINKTPTIFDARRLHAEILLKEGSYAKAFDEIGWMKDRVNARDANERRGNYRPYLETQAHYLTEVGQFVAAKEIYGDKTMFTEREREAAVREIEIIQGYANRR